MGGTNPAGSQWTKNPIPARGGVTGGFLHGSQCKTAQFKPPLADVIQGHPKYAPLNGLYGLGPEGHCIPGPTGWCSSDERKFWKERFNFDIIDEVRIPKDLPAGDYMLSWRWDSEQTPQVWTQCSDVTITDVKDLVAYPGDSCPGGSFSACFMDCMKYHTVMLCSEICGDKCPKRVVV